MFPLLAVEITGGLACCSCEIPPHTSGFLVQADVCEYEAVVEGAVQKTLLSLAGQPRRLRECTSARHFTPYRLTNPFAHCMLGLVLLLLLLLSTCVMRLIWKMS